MWPPETSSATQGVGSGPCSSRSTATCPARWLTPYSGLSSATASAFAAASPTTSAPISPGPAVTAMPSISGRSISAVAQARRSVGSIASRCARLATSGTTPPNRTCCSTLEATSFASSSVPADDADPGLVARRLDAQHQRPVRAHGRVPAAAGRGTWLGRPARQVPELQDQRVPALAVVVLPGGELLEPELLVRGDRRLVVVRHLEQHRSGAVMVDGQQSGPDQCAADPLRGGAAGDDEPVQVGTAVHGLEGDHADRVVRAGDQHAPPVAEQLAVPAALAPLLLGPNPSRSSAMIAARSSRRAGRMLISDAVIGRPSTVGRGGAARTCGGSGYGRVRSAQVERGAAGVGKTRAAEREAPRIEPSRSRPADRAGAG